MVAAPKRPAQPSGERESPLRMISPHLLVPSTPLTLRPPTSTISTVIWCGGPFGHGRHARRSLDGCARHVRRGGDRAVPPPITRRPDLRPGGPKQGRVGWSPRPSGGHGPIPRGPAPGDPGPGPGRRGRTSSTRTGPFRPVRPPWSPPDSCTPQHHHDAWWRRVREPGTGLRLSHPPVRSPVLRWTLQNAGALTAITDDCRQHALRAGAPPERIVWYSTEPISAASARARTAAGARPSDPI